MGFDQDLMAQTGVLEMERPLSASRDLGLGFAQVALTLLFEFLQIKRERSVDI